MTQSCIPPPSVTYPLRSEVRFASSAFSLKKSRGKIYSSLLFFKDAQNHLSSTCGGDCSNKFAYTIGSTSLKRLALVDSLMEFSI